jgi:uncharacterized membrane protein YagU involved in acid resistance
VLLGGTLAGTLDLLAAFIQGGLKGRGVTRVLQSIAGGLLGQEAYAGGLGTTVLGLGLHFFIATTAAGVYGVAARQWPLLTRRPFVCGLVYGAVVYLVMYGVVLPLSAWKLRFLNQSASAIATGLLIHLFCVGLPIALVHYRTTQSIRHP